MNFYPILENKRALLRPLEQQDAGSLAAIALSQPQLYRYTSATIFSEEDLIKYISQAITERNEKKAIPFLIFDKQTNAVAGTTRYGNIEEHHKRAEIGWTWIDEKCHGTGLNKAMKYLMLQHAFEIMDLNRVEIKTNEQNQRSRRAIESIGGQYEGLFRSHMINDDGTVRNTVYYSIIKEEWPGIKERIFSKYMGDWY